MGECMLQHWSCLFYRDPDLLLLLGHKCEVQLLPMDSRKGCLSGGQGPTLTLLCVLSWPFQA